MLVYCKPDLSWVQENCPPPPSPKKKIKVNRLFLLDKSWEFQNYYKVNIKRNQKTVLTRIVNDIKRPTIGTQHE